MKNNIGEKYLAIIEDILQGDIDNKDDALKQFLIETARYDNNVQNQVNAIVRKWKL